MSENVGHPMPLVGKNGRPMSPPMERLLTHVEKLGSGCWQWIGGDNGKRGYGMFYLNGKNVLAHRASWELSRGPIPIGLELDHLCRNRRCVNPSHLEPVTHRVNMLRGLRMNQNKGAAVCKRGHPFAATNLGIDIRGDRYCKECRRLRKRELAASRREVVAHV